MDGRGRSTDEQRTDEEQIYFEGVFVYVQRRVTSYILIRGEHFHLGLALELFHSIKAKGQALEVINEVPWPVWLLA